MWKGKDASGDVSSEQGGWFGKGNEGGTSGMRRGHEVNDPTQAPMIKLKNVPEGTTKEEYSFFFVGYCFLLHIMS